MEGKKNGCQSLLSDGPPWGVAVSEVDHTGWSAPPPAMGATQLNSLEQGTKRELVLVLSIGL